MIEVKFLLFFCLFVKCVYSAVVVTEKIPDQTVLARERFEYNVPSDLFENTEDDNGIVVRLKPNDYISSQYTNPSLKSEYISFNSTSIDCREEGSEHTIFITDESKGYLFIIDVSDVNQPNILSKFQFLPQDSPRINGFGGVVVGGDYAYIINTGSNKHITNWNPVDKATVFIIDISDMTNPVHVGTIDPEGGNNLCGVYQNKAMTVVNDDLLAIFDDAYQYDCRPTATNGGNLRLFDISNKTNPTLVGQFTSLFYECDYYRSFSQMREIGNNFVYAGCRMEGNAAFDVSDPSNIDATRFHISLSSLLDFVIKGDKMYTISRTWYQNDWTGYLKVHRFNSYDSVSEIQNFNLGRITLDTRINTVGDYLYIISDFRGADVGNYNHNDSMLVYKVESDGRCTFINEHVNHFFHDICSTETRSYGIGQEGILIIDPDAPPMDHPKITHFHFTSIEGSRMIERNDESHIIYAVSLDFIYTGSEMSIIALLVLDLSDHESANIIGKLTFEFKSTFEEPDSLFGGTADIAIYDDEYLYFVYGWDDTVYVKIVDISDTRKDPEFVSEIVIEDSADETTHVSVIVQDDYLYVGYSKFNIYDLSGNPESPVFVSSTDVPSGIMDIVEDFAFIADVSTNYVKAIDISDRENTEILGRGIGMNNPVGLKYFPYDRILIALTEKEGLKVYDTSSLFEGNKLLNQDLITTFGSPSDDFSIDKAINMHVDLLTVYIIDDSKKLYSVDLLDLSTPVLRETMDLFSSNLGYEANVVYSKDNLLVVGGKNGMKIYENDELLLLSADRYSSVCSPDSIEVELVGEDGSGNSASTKFRITKEDHCGGSGKCLRDYECECFEGYSGESCEMWKCGDYFHYDEDKVCGGNGECLSDTTCKCDPPYAGELCKANTLYMSVMLPVLSFGGVIAISVFCCIFCLVCCVCCLFLTICVFVITGCSCLVQVQKKGMKRYSQLKNIDLLLKEQELEKDTSVAHLEINKSLFEIPYEEIKLELVLGEGGSNSVVYKAKWKGQTCAFKSFKTRTVCGNQESFNDFEKEVHILGSVSHPNILQFFGCSLSPPRIGIVMEFCEKGDLIQFLNKKIKGLKAEQNEEESDSTTSSNDDEEEEQTIEKRDEFRHCYPIEEKLRMCMEVSSSMCYLHSRKILHRDLKLENVLVDGKERTKLMDFGLSRLVENMSQVKTKKIGTSIYMAPEIVLSVHYNEKVDVFSFAIMCYIILTENFSPYGNTITNVEFLVANNPSLRPNLDDERVKWKDFFTDDDEDDEEWISDMLIRSWSHEPSERPSFGELLDLFSSKLNRESKKASSGKLDKKSSRMNDNNTSQTPLDGNSVDRSIAVFGEEEAGRKSIIMDKKGSTELEFENETIIRLRLLLNEQDEKNEDLRLEELSLEKLEKDDESLIENLKQEIEGIKKKKEVYEELSDDDSTDEKEEGEESSREYNSSEEDRALESSSSSGGDGNSTETEEESSGSESDSQSEDE